MHKDSITPDDCALAGQQISSRLDSELSEFEEASLEAHLQHCLGCRAVAEGFGVVTAVLRATPLEEPPFPCWSPRVRRPRISVRQGASVAAAMAVVALSGLVGPQISVSSTPGPDARSRELIGLKERLLEQITRVDQQPTPAAPRRGVTAAEGTRLDSGSGGTPHGVDGKELVPSG